MEFPSHGFLNGKAFLSGFEIDTDTYDYKQELNHIKKQSIKKPERVMGLFKKKVSIPAEDNEMSIINPEADALLKECHNCINLCIHSSDLFESMLAFAFVLYLAENCSGIIYDTNSGGYFYNNIKEQMLDKVQKLLNEITPKYANYHIFEDWL